MTRVRRRSGISKAGAVSAQRRRGLTGDEVSVGDAVRVAGWASTRRDNYIQVSHILMPNGVELLVGGAREPRWAEESLGGNQDVLAESRAPDTMADGIFRVWSQGTGAWFFSGRSGYQLNEAAAAAVAEWDDIADNPIIKCVPPGMPALMGNPYPMQFVQVDDNIELRFEEFDALRIMFKHGMWRVDTFYSKIGEDASTATDAAGNPIHPDDKDVLAGNIHIAPFKELEIGLVDVLNINDVNGQKRYTVGGIISGKTSFGLSYSAEGYYQGGGADGDVDYSAYMFAVNPKFTVKSLSSKPFIAARFEMISGDSDPNDNTVKSFDTLFATNHKFYGEMDFFLNLPVHSGARGLMDIGPTVGWSPHKTVSVKLSHHYFRAAATRDDDLKEFGHEIDAKAVFKPYKGLAFDFNYSAFVPGDVFKSTTGSDDAEHFIYTTANAKF